MRSSSTGTTSPGSTPEATRHDAVLTGFNRIADLAYAAYGAYRGGQIDEAERLTSEILALLTEVQIMLLGVRSVAKPSEP